MYMYMYWYIKNYKKEKLQERITLMNMQLITKREENEKIIKDIEGFIDNFCHHLILDI